jgi:hypothetical protein
LWFEGNKALACQNWGYRCSCALRAVSGWVGFYDITAISASRRRPPDGNS